jgi:hypothetical protein
MRHGGETVNGLPAWLAIIRSEEANDLFTKTDLKLQSEAEGTREVYRHQETGEVVVEVKHAITDHHWIYIVPKTEEARAAVLAAARQLGLATRPLED